MNKVIIFKKATWQHLRIPFSIFLMPVFLFALSQNTVVYWWSTLIAFVAIHIFLYPASNAYNSYFDKDEDSIGGLEKPPPVSRELYKAALLFDVVAVLLAWWISSRFALALIIYGLVSKAYSHPSIRLKKYPFVSWVVVGVFQGAFTYLMSCMAIGGVSIRQLAEPIYWFPALLSTALLMASYPMTQVYQHQEDAKRGDKTLSLWLGVKGTFLFAGVAFFLANIGFVTYFYFFKTIEHIIVFEVVSVPTLAYFTWWFMQVKKDEQQANFKNTMRLNALSSILISLGFVLMLFLR